MAVWGGRVALYRWRPDFWCCVAQKSSRTTKQEERGFLISGRAVTNQRVDSHDGSATKTTALDCPFIVATRGRWGKRPQATEVEVEWGVIGQSAADTACLRRGQRSECSCCPSCAIKTCDGPRVPWEIIPLAARSLTPFASTHP